MLPVTVSDYSVQTDYGMYVQGKVELDGKKYGVRLYQDEYTDLTPGDQINGTFYLRCTLPASGEAPSHHSGKGIFFLLYSTDDPEISYGKQLLMKTSEVLDGPRSCKTDPLLEPLPLSPVRRVGHRKPPCND